MTIKTVIIIPARYASTRYPGKPLVNLKGADGEKTLIQRSWEVATSVVDASNVFVATDDVRIKETSESFGAQIIMTSESCRNGTERCADAISRANLNPDFVINFQGDAPLTPDWFVKDLIDAIVSSPDVDVATPVLRCDAATMTAFRDDRKAGRVGGTTAVFDKDHRALYFSKEVIPYSDSIDLQGIIPVFHHVGLYAFRTDALLAYPAMPVGPLELLEGLEQLRFLENAKNVKCVEVDARGRKFWELNNPTDVPLIENVLLKEPV